MSILRGLETILGLVVAGTAAIGFVHMLLLDGYCVSTNNGPVRCYRLYDISNPVVVAQNLTVLFYLGLLAIVFALAVASIIRYSRTRLARWRLLLWGTTLLILFIAFLSSIGFAFIPAATVLLVAAMVSLAIPAVRPAAIQPARGGGFYWRQ
ncbi:MAG TPA: hypothetical protein VF120_14230 [Ktedonobacterales bacterium]